MDSGVVQVILVGCSIGKEGVSQLVCAAVLNYGGPVVVSYVAINGISYGVGRLLTEDESILKEIESCK